MAKLRGQLEVMVSEDGFLDVGAQREGDEEKRRNENIHDNKGKDKDNMDLPLIGSTAFRGTSKIRVVDYVVCALVVIFMVASAQVSRILQVDYKFHNPAFIIWFSTSWLILCFPLQIIYHARFVRQKGSIVEILGGVDVLKKNMKLAPLFTVYWYLANYLFVWGLANTNVASSLAIEQVATIFVFILSVIFLKEMPTIGKILAVFICIGGVIVVAMSDNKNMNGAKDPLKGDLLIIGSCCATAAYMVTYKRVVGNTDVASVNTLLGFIGLCDLLFLWPVFTVLHFVEAEPLHPHSAAAWGLLLTNALLSFLFNYLLNLGIFFTSPLFFRVGQICSIPASFILDLLVRGLFVWMQLLGSLIVVLGFSLFSYFTHRS